MAVEPRIQSIEQIERLVREAAAKADQTRLLTEQVLRALGKVPQISRPGPDEESTDQDAESDWRLAA